MIQFGRSNISLSREQEQQYGDNKSTLFLTRDLSLKTLPRGSKKKTVTSSTLRRDVCLVLDLKNIKYALLEQVKHAYKRYLKDIKIKQELESHHPNQTKNYHENKAVYISEAGTIKKSNKESFQLISSLMRTPIS